MANASSSRKVAENDKRIDIIFFIFLHFEKLLEGGFLKNMRRVKLTGCEVP